MICEDCADAVPYHSTGKCIHCRETKVEELKLQIKELEV